MIVDDNYILLKTSLEVGMKWGQGEMGQFVTLHLSLIIKDSF